jgi:hypothetical protein
MSLCSLHYIASLVRYTTKYMQFDLIRLSSHKVYCLDVSGPIITKVIMNNTMKCILIVPHHPIVRARGTIDDKRKRGLRKTCGHLYILLTSHCMNIGCIHCTRALLRVVQSLNDKTEAFDDQLPNMKEEC